MKYIITILVTLLSFNISITYANNKIDSLYEALHSTDSYEEKLNIYVDLFNLISPQNADEAYIIYKEAIREISKSNNEIYRATLDLEYAVFQKKIGNFLPAFTNLKKALDKFQEFEVRDKEALVDYHISDLFIKLESYDNSFKYAFNGLERAKLIEDRELELKFCFTISKIFWNTQQFEKAIEYIDLAYEIAKDLDNKRYLAFSSNNKALIYSQMEKYDSALVHFRYTIDLFNQIDMSGMKARAKFNLADMYTKQEKFDSASYYLTLCFDEVMQSADTHLKINSILEFSKIFAKNKQHDSAAHYFSIAKGYVNNNYQPDLQLLFLEAEYQILKSLGNFEKADHVLLSKCTLNDSLNRAKQIDAIKKLNLITEMHDTEKDIVLHRNEESTQKKVETFLIVIAILSLLVTFLLFRRYQRNQYENNLMEIKNKEILAQKAELENINTELTSHKNQLSAIFNNAIAAICIFDTKGNIKFVNKAWSDMFQYSIEEAKNLTYKNVVNKDDVFKTDYFFNLLVDGKQDSYHIENRYVNKSGTIFWGDVSVSVLKDNNDIPEAVIAVIINITPRKMHQEALQNKNRFLEALVEDIPNPLYYKDTNGIYQGCNKHYQRFFNLEKEDIIGKTVHDLLPDEEADMFHKLDTELQENPGIKSIETVLNLQSYQRICIVNKATYYNNDSTVGGVIGVLNDITDIRHAEQQLKESEQKLKEANASKDKFFSIIAHDLKNPLQEILLASHMIIKNNQRGEHENLDTNIKHIHSSVTHVTELLQNLLQWSRSQSGTINFSPDYIDMHYLVGKVSKLLSTKAMKKNITLANNIDEDLVCYCDSNMIETVIRNLVSNALKFTHDKGIIEINSFEDEQNTTIEIKDNGIGISEEDLSKLFRIDVHHTTIGVQKEEGTGLGLILCQEFVEKNNGKIWVESKLGSGSSFKFTLPTVHTQI